MRRRQLSCTEQRVERVQHRIEWSCKVVSKRNIKYLSVMVAVLLLSAPALADFKMQSSAGCTATRPADQNFYYGYFRNFGTQTSSVLSCPIEETTDFKVSSVTAVWIHGGGPGSMSASVCSAIPGGAISCGAPSSAPSTPGWFYIADLSQWSDKVGFAFRFLNVSHPNQTIMMGYYLAY